MGKCREIHNAAFAKTLLLSLQQEFEKLQDNSDGSVDTTSKDFVAIKVCAGYWKATCRMSMAIVLDSKGL